MLKVSDTHIASVAENATDAIGVVTVINMKAFSIVVAPTTNSAFSLLSFQHPRKFSKLKAVEFFAVVIGKAFGIFVPTLFLIFGQICKILPAPFVIANRTARFAVDLITVHSGFGFVKFRQWLDLLAARAELFARRQVNWMSAHVRFLSVENTLTECFL